MTQQTDSNSADNFVIELLVEQFTGMEDGEFISYSEMSALSGYDLQFKHRHLLDKSLRIALDEHGIVFENKRNLGYEKLSDEDVVKRLKEPSRIRNSTIRGRKKLSLGVDYDKLDPVLQAKHNAKFLVLAVIDSIASEKTIKSIECRVGDIEMRVNLQKAIDLISETVNENE